MQAEEPPQPRRERGRVALARDPRGSAQRVALRTTQPQRRHGSAAVRGVEAGVATGPARAGWPRRTQRAPALARLVATPRPTAPGPVRTPAGPTPPPPLRG